MLICGACGGRMTRKSIPYKGNHYHYYYCPAGKKNGCTGSGMIKEAGLIECVLESLKAHISNIVSVDSLFSDGGNQTAVNSIAAWHNEQIAENGRQLETILSFKSKIYELMIKGKLTKQEHKEYKANYTADETRLKTAIAELERERDNILSGKSERLKWAEHFKKHENLIELDSTVVANLIQSIRVISKTELEITFNYQFEYEKAVAALNGVSQGTVHDEGVA
jgi:hypothetical protein